MWEAGTQQTRKSIGGMIVELTPSEEKMRTKELIKLWKASIPAEEGLKSLTINERKGGPPRLDIDIRLISKSSTLMEMKLAASLLEKLELYQGVSDVKDNLPIGKREISFKVTEKEGA